MKIWIDLKEIKKTIDWHWWKRWDMFWLCIDSKTEAALLAAEIDNDEERYNGIWFCALVPEGDAWWHT